MTPTEKLAKIKEILSYIYQETSPGGLKYTVSDDAAENLEGVILDIEHGIITERTSLKIDESCLNSIKSVYQQIIEVMNILNEPDA
jgi:hypothetical protein